MPHRSNFRPRWGLALFMLLGACAGTPGRGTPRHYAWDNSVAAACRSNPANCAALTGKPATAPGHAVATAGYTVHQTLRILDDATKASIAEALKKCADEARSEVLLRYDGYFKGVSPTAEECQEGVLDARGKRITWAMKLGLEMHDVALKCAADQLGKLRPGGFSIEPRYRYDLQTRQKRLVSPSEERALEESGNGAELLGTIKPDIVLHSGDPLQAQAIYDFKFPCVNAAKPPESRRYPKEHPYQGQTQEEVYEQFFKIAPLRVVPRLGVIR